MTNAHGSALSQIDEHGSVEGGENNASDGKQGVKGLMGEETEKSFERLEEAMSGEEDASGEEEVQGSHERADQQSRKRSKGEDGGLAASQTASMGGPGHQTTPQGGVADEVAALRGNRTRAISTAEIGSRQDESQADAETERRQRVGEGGRGDEETRRDVETRRDETRRDVLSRKSHGRAQTGTSSPRDLRRTETPA